MPNIQLNACAMMVAMGHARYPPVEYHHEQKVQYDVDDARYDKEQQRRFAVAQALKDAGVGIIPQAADQPAQHDDHVDPALVRGCRPGPPATR